MKINVWFSTIMLIVLMGFGFVISEAQAQTGGCSTTHIVQRGETLYRIALRYNTTMADIQARNSISNPNRIYAGQQLCISGGFVPPNTPVPGGGVTHAGLGTVNTWLLNVRSGPGTNYSVLRLARRGEKFPIFGRNADTTWIKIEVDAVAGVQGWVSAAYFDVVNVYNLPVVSSDAVQPYSGNFTLVRNASLHITPDGNQGIVPQELGAGTTVRVIGRNAAASWFEITTNDGNRWVRLDVFPAEFPRDLFSVTG